MQTSPLLQAPMSGPRLACWTSLALAAIVAWDASGLDAWAAGFFGNANGFALRFDWFLVHVAHEGVRRLAWLLVLALTLGVWWPWGVLRRIPAVRRVQWVLSALLGLAAIALFKYTSTTSCPWDLAEFGGLARHVSHWRLGQIDGGSGHCFPAGHASAGFAFVGGYFALRQHAPGAARCWLLAALTGGLLLGLGQQARGAHFMSHTLWTAWLCWSIAWLLDLALPALQRCLAEPRHAGRTPQT